MKTRSEIKKEARKAFKEQYWPCVAVPFIYIAGACILVGLFVLVLFIVNSWLLPVASLWGALIYSAMIFAIYLVVFPLIIGITLFYIYVFSGRRARIADLLQGFNLFWRNVGAIFWMSLWTYIWALLFIIPGYVKFFAYRFTPCLLAEHKNLKARAALKISMKITNGHKMDLFVFYLSFIGWMLLPYLPFVCFSLIDWMIPAYLALGALFVFFSLPYFYIALSGYYLELKKEALAKGIITLSDLGEEEAGADMGGALLPDDHVIKETEIYMSKDPDGDH